jgi:polysaccharide pyruvyl transferase WcaK-like protein
LLDKLGIGKNADNRFAVVAVRGTSGKGYIKILAEWLEALSLGGIRLIFIPMFPKEDLYESRRLALALGGIVAEGLSESDTVGIMSQSCVVCGMRLHSLIFAHSASVPFVGFGADPKIESFCRENGGLYFTELY